MLKMFSVNMSSDNIVECISEFALLAEVHLFLQSVSLYGAVSQDGSAWVAIVQLQRVGDVEYFDMGLQGTSVCTERTVGTVEQKLTLQYFPVHITEVIFVAGVIFGRKSALCAAKLLRSVPLKI